MGNEWTRETPERRLHQLLRDVTTSRGLLAIGERERDKERERDRGAADPFGALSRERPTIRKHSFV
jgi:hypothetical protein